MNKVAMVASGQIRPVFSNMDLHQELHQYKMAVWSLCAHVSESTVEESYFTSVEIDPKNQLDIVLIHQNWEK
jgi:hypothetical protein